MPRRITAYECKHCHKLFKFEDKDLCEYHEGECLDNSQNQTEEFSNSQEDKFDSLQNIDNQTN